MKTAQFSPGLGSAGHRWLGACPEGSLLSEQVTLEGGDCTAALVEGKGAYGSGLRASPTCPPGAAVSFPQP